MRAALVVACLLVGTASLAAHHSFVAEYDGALRVTVSGTVAKIDWQNPHISLYLDAKDDQGKMAQWKFEGYPPNVLVRQGWKPDTTIKVGDTVTITGWRARLDPYQGAADEVIFADGKKLKAGSQAEFKK